MQDDPLDPGGYFISNGTERVLITVEDLAPNRVLVEKTSRYGRSVEVAKVFSQKEGYRALTVVEKKKDGMLMVSLPTTYGQIPLMILLRSLGMENDEEIAPLLEMFQTFRSELIIDAASDSLGNKRTRLLCLCGILRDGLG